MSKLQDMSNIGKTLEKRLIDAGINTPDELRRIGSKQAFIKVKTVFPSACAVHLYAIDGAVRGIPMEHLSDEVKDDLKSFVNSL